MKQLVILIITILLSYKTISQTSPLLKTDSVTCLLNSDLRKAAILIERGKFALAERNVARDSIRTLLLRVSLKDTIINEHVKKDIINDNLIDSYKKEVDILERELKTSKDITANTEKLYKRQKLKTKFAFGIPVLAATALLTLLK